MTGPANYAKLFIGGEWVQPSSSEVLQVINPYTRDVVARSGGRDA